MLGLMRWLLIIPWWLLLPNDWLPPTLRRGMTGPFNIILLSSWSQMGRVAGDWFDTGSTVLRSLLSFTAPPTNVALL